MGIELVEVKRHIRGKADVTNLNAVGRIKYENAIFLAVAFKNLVMVHGGIALLGRASVLCKT